MKIDARSVARFMRAPDPAARAILLYGPDGGLVRERGGDLARLVVDDLHDPFRVAEFSGDALADDPARLADEAAALALTGGRRVVRVRPAGNECAPAFARFLQHPAGDALIVVEAGDLDGRSALRKLFEGADNAAAIACYRDEASNLAKVIRETLAAAEVTAEPDAVDWLAQRLGGDRQVTRRELEKLALYVGAGNAATLADAQACVGDSAEIDLDDLVHAVGEGDITALERALMRLSAEGVSPIQIVRAAQRHFARLHLCAGLISAGGDESSAMRSLRPPVFWKDDARFRRQLKRWPPAAARLAMEALLAAEMRAKTGGQSALAELEIGRCLLDIARSGGRRAA